MSYALDIWAPAEIETARAADAPTETTSWSGSVNRADVIVEPVRQYRAGLDACNR